MKTAVVAISAFLLSIAVSALSAEPKKSDGPANQAESRSMYDKKPAKPKNEERKDSEIYIPKDLDDCFAELKKVLPKKILDEMAKGSEEDMIRYHHGLGTWLRNNWGLWKGSRLSKWFNDRGIFHPDDMSGIIFDSFWRHLHDKPIKLDEQIKYYKDYWERAEKQHEELRKKEAKQ